VVVQGEPVVSIADIQSMPGQNIAPIMDRLASIKQKVIGPSTQIIADSQEVTILADKSIPFNVIKRIMSTCTAQGYGQISLAVIQKAAQTSES
jgi:hypothetical protein